MSLLEKIFQKFPDLPVNDHIVLREIDPQADSDAYYELLNQPAVSPFIPDSCIPKDAAAAANTLAFMRDLFPDKKSCYWGIEDQTTGKLIGTGGFESWNRFHNRVELVYELHPDYWRTGVMTEAILQMRYYAFQTMKANRVDAFTITNNMPSIQLLKKLGFKQEGVLRKYRFYKGKFVDICIFSSVFADKVNQMPLPRQRAQIKDGKFS